MRSYPSIAAAIICLAVFSGCSALPDFRKLDFYTDQMVHSASVMAGHMPIMRDSMGRMANNMDRMATKSASSRDKIMDQLDSKERSLRNYMQAYVDGDRAIIKALRDIQQELSELKQAFRTADKQGAAPTASLTDKDLQARAQDVQARLDSLLEQIDKMEKKPL